MRNCCIGLSSTCRESGHGGSGNLRLGEDCPPDEGAGSGLKLIPEASHSGTDLEDRDRRCVESDAAQVHNGDEFFT
jgi:hypothetical protein